MSTSRHYKVCAKPSTTSESYLYSRCMHLISSVCLQPRSSLQIGRNKLRDFASILHQGCQRLREDRRPVSQCLVPKPQGCQTDSGRDSITAAGVCPDQSFLDRDPKDVERTIKINVLGTYYATQLAARQMVKQGRRSSEMTASAGSVVHIASVSAHERPAHQCTSDYSASKGAVLGLTKELGAELGAVGIRVNSISPG